MQHFILRQNFEQAQSSLNSAVWRC